MISIILNVALWVLTITAYVIYNLYKKNEKLEDIVHAQSSLINSLSIIIDESNRMMDELDKRGAFKSDDEIGFFFNTVKNIQGALNEFKNNAKL